MRTGYYNFSGGINYRDNVLAINELEDGNNLYWEKGLVRRKGCQTRNATLTYTGGTVNKILNHWWFRHGSTDIYFLFADIDIEEVFTVTARADVSGDTGGKYFTFSDNTTDYYVYCDTGHNEISDVTLPAQVGGGLNGKYWNLFSGGDATTYYVWYTGAADVGADPAPGGTGIKVALGSNTQTDAQVATATAAVITALGDFTATAAAEVVTVETAAHGVTTDASDGDMGGAWAVNVTQQGTAGNADPAPAGKTGIHAHHNVNATANTVAAAIDTAIQASAANVTVSTSSEVVTVTQVAEGNVTDAADVDSNQEVKVTRNGNLVGVYKFSAIPSSRTDAFTVVDGVYHNGYCEVSQFRDKVWIATGADNPFVVYDQNGTWVVKEVPLCDYKNDHANYGYQNFKREIFTVTTTAAGAHDGEYWTFTNGVDDYYVWYDEADASTDPEVADRIGIEVDHLAADTDAQVATKTEAALQNVPGLTTSVASNVVTVTLSRPSVDSDVADGDVGFAYAVSTAATLGDGARIINNTKNSDETAKEDTWKGCNDVVTQKNYLYITDFETLYFAEISFATDPAGIAWDGTDEPDKDLLGSGALTPWNIDQWLGLEDSADVTGMVGHEDFVILYGKRAAYVFVNRNFFNGDYVYDKIGTVGLRGVPAPTNAGLYGVADDGIYGWDGDNVVNLGKKIWPNIQTSIDASAYSDLDTCSVAMHKGRVWISIPAYNKIFIFDPDRIYVDETGDNHAPMYKLTHQKNSSAIGFELLLPVEGKLFAIEKDSATLVELDILYDDYEDDATNETGVDYLVQTAYLDQDTPSIQKIYKRAEFEVTANINDMGDMDIFIFSENGEESDVDTDLDTTVPTGQGSRAYLLENLPYEVDGHNISFKITVDASSSDGETIPTMFGFKLEYDLKEI